MPNITITSGGLEVLASGVIQSNGLNPVEIVIGGVPPITLRLNCTQTQDGASGWVASPSGTTLDFTIKNPVGGGMSAPIKIGKVEGRELHISIIGQSFGVPSPNFVYTYTLYLGRAAT